MLNIAVRPESYDEELAAKVAAVRLSLSSSQLALPEQVDVYASAPRHFRLRAEFGVWHQDGRTYLCMFPKKGCPVEVTAEDFPMGSELMCSLMPRLLAAVQSSEALNGGLFVARFHTTLSGEALLTLVYHRALDEAWRAEAEALRVSLGLVGLVGRSRGQKVVLGRDFLDEQLLVAGRQIHYRQLEETFSQSNGGIAQHMFTWAVQAALDGASARNDDLLELYCGSGAFTVALAPCFRRVLATEVSKGAVAVCAHNLHRNGVHNTLLGRVSAEELREAMEGVRAYQRLAHVELPTMQLNTVLVDPPRAGLGAQVSTFLARFERILYISCNPETMVEDVARLRGTHELKRFACFDQFAYTPHLECGALLVRRRGME